MGSTNGQRMDFEHYKEEIQNSIPHTSARTTYGIHISPVPNNSRLTFLSSNRAGDTESTDEGRDRASNRSWFPISVIHRHKENRRPTPRFEPKTAQPVYSSPSAQNGNNPTGVPNGKQKRLPYIYQLTRCVSPHHIPFSIPKIPPVPLENDVFQFKTLAFGLSLSPLVFTKILKPVLRWARRKGIRASAYLDDLVIVGKKKEQTHLHTSMVLQKLEELGYLYKNSKSHLIPSQKIDHLGFTIDSTNMTLSVPLNKRRDLRREASRLLQKQSCTLRVLSSFIGKVQAMSPAVFPVRINVQLIRMCQKVGTKQVYQN